MMAQGPQRFSTIDKPVLRTFEILIFYFSTFHMASEVGGVRPTGKWEVPGFGSLLCRSRLSLWSGHAPRHAPLPSCWQLLGF